MSLTIYHNPRCSKSRQTLARIEEAGVTPTIVRYLNTPPDAATLAAVLAKLDRPATDLVRFKEDEAKSLGLTPTDDRATDDWLAILAAHPKLLERPIVVSDQRAIIGRPPENVDSLLG